MHRLACIVGVFALTFGCKAPETSLTTTSSSQEVQRYHAGLRAYLKGDYTTASTEANAVLALNPNHDAALYLMSKIYFDQENWEAASDYLIKAGKADPKNAFLLGEIGYMYSARGEFEAAAKIYESLVAKEPYQTAHYFGGVENSIKGENFNDALGILERQEKNLGNSIEIVLNKHRIYRLMGQMQKAILVLENGLIVFPGEPELIAPLVDDYFESKDTQKGIDLLAKLCVADPTNGIAKMLFGNYLIDAGKLEEGEQYLSEAVLLEGITLEQKAEILLRKTKSIGCTPQLQELLKKFQKQHQNELIANTLLGDLYITCGEPYNALPYFSNAVSLSPNAFPVWNTVLLICYREELWDSLYVNSQKAIDFFPVQALPYFMLGEAQIQKGQFKEAKATLRDGKTYVINDPELEAQFLAKEGVIYAKEGDFKNASTTLSKALRMAPKNQSLKTEVASSLLDEPNFVTFVDSLINDGMNAAPENADFIALKGKKIFLDGDLISSQNWIEKAMGIGYPARFGLEILGDIAMKKGMKERAVDYWQQAERKGNKTTRLQVKLLNK